MYCPKCGTELPAEARFCPNCGDEINLSHINPARQDSADPKGNVYEHYNTSILAAAVSKFKEQMKLAHLLNIVCDGVALLYALIVPEYKLDFNDEAIATIILMGGIMILGVVLLIIGAVYAAKTYDAMLGQPGAWKTIEITSADQADIKYSGKLYAEISGALILGSIILLSIRYAMR